MTTIFCQQGLRVAHPIPLEKLYVSGGNEKCDGSNQGASISLTPFSKMFVPANFLNGEEIDK